MLPVSSMPEAVEIEKKKKKEIQKTDQDIWKER